MNWKDIFGLFQNIVGIAPTFYYGFRHYVMKKDHYEWDKRDDIDKVIFYIITSPIWLIIGIVKLLGWIVYKICDYNKQAEASPCINDASTQSLNTPQIMIVKDIFDIKGKGPVITGRIERGRIARGDAIKIIDVDKTFKTKCIGIECKGKLVDNATVGEEVGLLLQNIDINNLHVGQSVIK